ncbi:Y-family DNA polymerase [Thalassotalea euphylliae]|uniref:DNA polymerase Y family protein n=1 Tax=Thalassotalea euphylliae TaxID=1655234 RepID=A0A3E0UEZ3_9GAMM|nr:DNA polymerase Y family protein [Thalassotalea euphylliae]REL35568.1 DNA polymerase Y family protein [Thalassotalea euphylliae]
MNLWLYLHFPALQLSTIYQPTDQQALIIVDEKSNEVIQLNQYAKNQGINLGMGLGTAASLCHELEVKVYDKKVEARLLKHIAHWLYSKTADITIFAANGLLLRVSNMLSLYRDLAHYWQVLSQHLNTLKLEYHYACAYSPFAAKLLATQKLDKLSESQDWLTRQIKQQSLVHADLNINMVNRLQKVGISHLGDLLKVPLAELSTRFDVEVVHYIGQLTGKIPHPVQFYIPPEPFEYYLELYYEVSNQQYLSKPLLKQFLLLEKHLRLKDMLATELTLCLHQRDSENLVLTITALQGEYKADKWLALTELNLASIKLVEPIIGLTLTTKRLTRKGTQANDLFLGSQGELSAQELVTNLVAKLGQERVKGLATKQDARPEIANQLCPPFSVNSQPSSTKLRPTFLLTTPSPLKEPVKIVSPPERIIAGWWDDYQVVRDYFIGRSEQGRWLWLFRDHNQQWFIHGLFS